MSNPSKQKGTGEETAIVNRINEFDGRSRARRAPNGAHYDVHVDTAGDACYEFIDVLSTRADRGERLVTLRFEDFLDIWAYSALGLHIESKRYARFALHTIFFSKFGRKK
jgi:hypothetical protein